MTKKERIAVLESQVAELTARLAAVEARPVVHPSTTPSVWPHDGVPFWGPYVTCNGTGGATTTLTGNITDTCVQSPSISTVYR